MRPVIGLASLGALLAAGVVLIVVELTQGASDFGEVSLADPCETRTAFDGDGLEGSLQQIVLDGIDGAACELGATREALVLSFVPGIGDPIQWDDATIEAAVRSGLEQSVDNAEQRGSIGDVRATLLRELVREAPLDFLIDSGSRLASVISASPGPIEPDALAEDIRAALLAALDASEEDGSVGTVEAFALRQVIERLPVSFLVDLGLRVRDVVTESDDPFSRDTLIDAVRLALVDVIDGAEEDGSLGPVPATVLREIVQRLPIGALISVGERVGSLVD